MVPSHGISLSLHHSIPPSLHLSTLQPNSKARKINECQSRGGALNVCFCRLRESHQYTNCWVLHANIVADCDRGSASRLQARLFTRFCLTFDWMTPRGSGGEKTGWGWEEERVRMGVRFSIPLLNQPVEQAPGEEAAVIAGWDLSYTHTPTQTDTQTRHFCLFFLGALWHTVTLVGAAKCTALTRTNRETHTNKPPALI